MSEVATHCLRQLLLPIHSTNEIECSIEFEEYLIELGIAELDFPNWISFELAAWKDAGRPSNQLLQLVKRLLSIADVLQITTPNKGYFVLHSKLTDSLMSHDEARGLLSNASLICELAKKEKHSAAQISRLLARSNYLYSRRAIELILTSAALNPSLKTVDVEALFAKEQDAEIDFFADSDLSTSISLVANQAIQFGFAGPMEQYLTNLAPEEDLVKYGPYLQALHFQCIITEFYDHAVTDLYEFSPRGKTASWVFDQYPDTISSAGNPFLNNMKSVTKIDDAWALSKKNGELPGALALWQILTSLESQAFAARKQTGKILRLWIHRVIRLSKPNAIPLPGNLSNLNIAHIRDWVTEGNTETFGIVEQRIVDVISQSLHIEVDGWRSRGLGDSVNATNISRRKLGDCDFQNTATRKIFAYESHGGILTDVYVREHLRTLRKALELRIEEMVSTANPADWQIHLIFVAHGFNILAVLPTTILGVPLSIEMKSFEDFVSIEVAAPEWDSFFLTPMKAHRTPLEVKHELLLVL